MFYYLIRQGEDAVGMLRTDNKFGENAMLGPYRLEPISQSEFETLDEFEVLEDALKSEK